MCVDAGRANLRRFMPDWLSSWPLGQSGIRHEKEAGKEQGGESSHGQMATRLLDREEVRLSLDVETADEVSSMVSTNDQRQKICKSAGCRRSLP